jgi:hypothetical protein
VDQGSALNIVLIILGVSFVLLSIGRKFREWIASTNPQGIGTLLVGIAALCALWQTNSILERVLKIQEQSENIQKAVELLTSQIKNLNVAHAISASPILKDPEATKSQIDIELNKFFMQTPAPGQSTVFLPIGKKSQTVDLLQKEKNPEQRQLILQNALEYQYAPGKMTVDLPVKNPNH